VAQDAVALQHYVMAGRVEFGPEHLSAPAGQQHATNDLPEELVLEQLFASPAGASAPGIGL